MLSWKIKSKMAFCSRKTRNIILKGNYFNQKRTVSVSPYVGFSHASRFSRTDERFPMFRSHLPADAHQLQVYRLRKELVVSPPNKLGRQGNRATNWYIHHARNRSCHCCLLHGGQSAAPVGPQTCTTSNTSVGNEAFLTLNGFYWAEDVLIWSMSAMGGLCISSQEAIKHSQKVHANNSVLIWIFMFLNVFFPFPAFLIFCITQGLLWRQRFHVPAALCGSGVINSVSVTSAGFSSYVQWLGGSMKCGKEERQAIISVCGRQSG